MQLKHSKENPVNKLAHEYRLRVSRNHCHLIPQAVSPHSGLAVLGEQELK